MEFAIEDYECRNGRKYVEEFLSALAIKNPDLWAKTVAQIKRMKFRNYQKYPDSEALGDGLFTVRTRLKTDITRVFYCFGKGQRIYLLRGFVKQEEKISNKEMTKARKLLMEFRERGI